MNVPCLHTLLEQGLSNANSPLHERLTLVGQGKAPALPHKGVQMVVRRSVYI